MPRRAAAAVLALSIACGSHRDGAAGTPFPVTAVADPRAPPPGDPAADPSPELHVLPSWIAGLAPAWARSFEGAVVAAAPAKDAGVLVVTQLAPAGRGSTGFIDVYRLDRSGGVVWSTRWTDTAAHAVMVRGVAAMPDGGAAVAFGPADAPPGGVGVRGVQLAGPAVVRLDRGGRALWWRAPANASTHPMIDTSPDGRIAVSGQDLEVLAPDGRVLWTRPAVTGPALFDRGGDLLALDSPTEVLVKLAPSGAPRWTATGVAGFLEAVGPGVVGLVSTPGQVRGLAQRDLRDGSPRDTLASVLGSFAFAPDGSVLAASSDPRAVDVVQYAAAGAFRAAARVADAKPGTAGAVALVDPSGAEYVVRLGRWVAAIAPAPPAPRPDVGPPVRLDLVAGHPQAVAADPSGGDAVTTFSPATILRRDATGSVRWRVAMPDRCSAGDIAAADGGGAWVAVACDGGDLGLGRLDSVALVRLGPDGAPVWQRPRGVLCDLHPAVGPDGRVASACSGEVQVVDASGVASFTTEGAAAAFDASGSLYVVDGAGATGRLARLDGRGAPTWETASAPAFRRVVASATGLVVTFDPLLPDESVAGFDAASGEPVFVLADPGIDVAAVAVTASSDVLVAGSERSGCREPLLVRFSRTGERLGAKRVGTNVTCFAPPQVSAIAATTRGTVLVTGDVIGGGDLGFGMLGKPGADLPDTPGFVLEVTPP